MTRTIDIGCDFGYSATAPTPVVFQVEPRTDSGIAQQDRATISGRRWSVTGDLPTTDYTDLYGNHCRRMVLPAGQTEVSFHATAVVVDELDEADPQAPEVPPQDLPAETLVYTVASRFCESDRLSATAWKLFGGEPAGYRRVNAVSAWTHSHLTYTSGSTTAVNTAVDSYVSTRGVCRDYAHLMISLCRGLNVPARYAAGYLPELDTPPNPAPMDFHAWVEVWLGDRWWVFDPRHHARRKGRVKIGHGRDAADLASATMYGSLRLTRFDIQAHEKTPKPA